MAKKSQQLYVGIPDSTAVRKGLLYGSKDVLQALKRYEHVKEIRDKKIELMFQYQKELSGIRKDLRRLEKIMPKTPAKKKVDLPSKQPTKVARQKVVVPPAEDQTLKELTNQLDSIERKLSKLER